MSQPEKKPKLSDIAHQTNTDKADKAKRFSSTMIPAPPLPKSSAPVAHSSTAPPVSEKQQPGEPASAEEQGGGVPVEAPQTSSKAPESIAVDRSAPAPAKATRPRRGGPFVIDDVISGEPPKGETYPHQMRVSAHHHKLLRKLAFTHEVTMNHVLYNLLDLLDQVDQRDQQKGD